MPIPVFYGIGITLPVVLDFLLLVDPLVHRGLVHGLGLFDKWRCADLHSNGEFVCLFTEGCVRGNDRAQVRGRRRERGRQGLEDSLNVLRKLGSCGLHGGKGQVSGQYTCLRQERTRKRRDTDNDSGSTTTMNGEATR